MKTAWLNGWFAHMGNKSVDDNPYDEVTMLASHSFWLSGWTSRRNSVRIYQEEHLRYLDRKYTTESMEEDYGQSQ